MLNESRVPSVIKDVIIIVIGIVIIWAVFHYFVPNGNPFYIVSSGSMFPVLKVDDILIVGGGNSFNDLKVGDIIVFHRPAGENRVIVHRVTQIQNDFSGHRVLITKGDANSVSIPGTDFPIRENNFIGKVIYVIPMVGAIPKLLSPPVNYLIIAAILIGLIASKLVNLKKKKSRMN